jgi:hypothetical protein
MSQAAAQLRAVADAAYAAINAGDLDAFLAVTTDDVEFTSLVSGNRGVACVRLAGTISDVPLEQTVWQAVRMREGKASWWAFFRTEREALAAVGLAD